MSNPPMVKVIPILRASPAFVPFQVSQLLVSLAVAGTHLVVVVVLHLLPVHISDHQSPVMTRLTQVTRMIIHEMKENVMPLSTAFELIW